MVTSISGAQSPSSRLALFQCEPLPIGAADPVAANLARVRSACANAAAEGADLLVCPEMFLAGYAIGAARTRALAEPRDGASAAAVAAIARACGIAICYGYPELDADGAIYNAAQCIDADGAPFAHHRKTHLYGDLDRAQFSAGAEPATVVIWRGWRLGLLICYDIEFPECARGLALAGADLVLVPTANMQAFDMVPDQIVPTRAYENQMEIAYANYSGAEGEIVYGGLSCVAHADGIAPARAGPDATLLIADLDGVRLAASRAATPYLRDRRPALYA